MFFSDEALYARLNSKEEIKDEQNQNNQLPVESAQNLPA
jgi:hypothetical protein